MKGMTEYDKCWNQLFFNLWDRTTGQATNWRECYRGAKFFARFVLAEIERQRVLTLERETALARRGLVPANSILNCWIWNIVEDCSLLRAPLPPEMLDVLYSRLGCNHRSAHDADEARNTARLRFARMFESNPNLSTRATARQLGVDPATIVRWKKEPPTDGEERDQEIYTKISELTKFPEFSERAFRALRR